MVPVAPIITGITLLLLLLLLSVRLPISEKDVSTAAKPANGEMSEHSGLLSATLKAFIVFRINLGFVTIHRGSVINTTDPYSESPGL